MPAHQYKALVVCPGLKLNWHGIEGLVETLGKMGWRLTIVMI